MRVCRENQDARPALFITDDCAWQGLSSHSHLRTHASPVYYPCIFTHAPLLPHQHSSPAPIVLCTHPRTHPLADSHSQPPASPAAPAIGKKVEQGALAQARAALDHYHNMDARFPKLDALLDLDTAYGAYAIERVADGMAHKRVSRLYYSVQVIVCIL